MPGSIRPNKQAMNIAYKILNIPKDQRQKPEPKPSEKLIKEWFRDSSTAQ
jgi:hypothetical protein